MSREIIVLTDVALITCVVQRGLADEVVKLVVSTEQADRIFEKIYLAAQLDTPGKGIIYITPLEKVATYVPPDIIAKLTATEEEGENPE